MLNKFTGFRWVQQRRLSYQFFLNTNKLLVCGRCCFLEWICLVFLFLLKLFRKKSVALPRNPCQAIIINFRKLRRKKQQQFIIMLKKIFIFLDSTRFFLILLLCCKNRRSFFKKRGLGMKINFFFLIKIYEIFLQIVYWKT